MPVNIKAKLLKKEELVTGIFKFTVQANEIVETAKAGNFVEIRVNDDIEPFLRRPISIYNIDKENGILADYLMKDNKTNSSYVTTKEEGKESKLEYSLIHKATKDDKVYALYDIHLLTGRHHQIRI